MGSIRFREEQDYDQPAIWIGLFGTMIVSIVVLLSLLSWDDETTFTRNLIIIVSIIIVNFVLIGIFKFVKLEAVITDSGIFIRWLPFSSNYTSYPWREVTKAVVEDYLATRPAHMKRKQHDAVYVLRGNKGVTFYLVNGKSIYLGSQKSGKLLTELLRLPLRVEQQSVSSK